MFHGLRPYYCSLCLLSHGLSSVSVSSPCLSLLSTRVLAFRAHLNDPGRSYLEILNYICKELISRSGHIHRFGGLGSGQICFTSHHLLPRHMLHTDTHVLLQTGLQAKGQGRYPRSTPPQEWTLGLCPWAPPFQSGQSLHYSW